MRWVLAMVLTLLVAAPASAAETTRTEAAGLRFTLPTAWRRVPTVVENRAAMYVLPPAAGEMGDTEFVVSVSVDGSAAETQRILEAWYRRFVQPDGGPSREAAVVSVRTARGLKVTAVDLQGTYVGRGSSARARQVGVSGYHLLGAVVEGERRSWILHLFGPTATVAGAKADFEVLLGSLESHR
jgi:hypothetical protein